MNSNKLYATKNNKISKKVDKSKQLMRTVRNNTNGLYDITIQKTNIDENCVMPEIKNMSMKNTNNKKLIPLLPTKKVYNTPIMKKLLPTC